MKRPLERFKINLKPRGKGIMKNFGALLFIILLVSCLYSATGAIRGVVYDATTGKPLPGADVYLEDEKIGTSAISTEAMSF